MSDKPIIVRQANGTDIRQTTKDGYFDATAMCQAHGKLFANWHQTDAAKEYLAALEVIIGIPIIKLVVSLTGRYGGTWVHPLVANRLAQWCSPTFAVKVDQWIEELKRGNYPQAQVNDAAVLPILERHTAQIEDLDGRVMGLEGPKREKRNREHDRLLRAACRRMGGKCPCGCGRQMLNPNGSFVDGVQIDHWNELRHDNRLANKWPIFQPCHTQKHKRTDDFFLAFTAFQKLLWRMVEEETAITPPSPHARRVIAELNAKHFGRSAEAAE